MVMRRLMLNGSSNTTASGQTYTFQQVSHNPSNWVNLALVNGQTAYQGGNLTIGPSGSMLVSNTKATISGLVTNNGSLSFVYATATFQNKVYNNGAWITDPSTNIFQSTYTLNSNGSISMSAGDVFIFTNGASTVGSFINLSTQSNTTSLLNGKFVFNSTLSTTQQLATAGDNIGNLSTAHDFSQVLVSTIDTTLLSQYSNNFAVGELQLSGTSTTLVFDVSAAGCWSHATTEAALFRNMLLGWMWI